MINIRKLRRTLERFISWEERESVNDRYINKRSEKKRITIKRKKKMILEQIPNGDVKLKRRSVIKIEIIE